ncbi:autotransporter-associated beta strand repeat-containing protein [Sandarakinorhabdus sp. DWP1-3-1]|uniref:autotransporter-associated beta strand repeat-containing protein n=1 Tax=Sandarakinorhabdus sp. DWP1-3-1 TaxID=2804627 RepID=UPI003CEE2FA3
MATSALVRAARITVSATGLAVVGLSPAAAQTLDLAGANQTINSFAPYNDIFNSTGSATLTAQLLSAQTYAGVLRDNGGVLGLTKTGAGALTLTGANTYSGVTTIGASSRIIAGAANTLSAASLLNTTSTGVLDMAGFGQTINGLVGTGANGGVRNTGALATLTISSATDHSFAGNIGGNSGAGDAIRVIKTGAGLQRFSRASNYTGGTQLAAGTLGFGSGGAFGTGAIDVTGNARMTSFGSALTVANDINLGARLSLGGLPFTLSGVISGAGSLDLTGGGAALTGLNTFGGGIILNGSGLIVGSSSSTGAGAILASDNTSSFTVSAAAFASVTNVTLSNDIVLSFASPDRGINFRAPVAGQSLTLDGTISGNGRLFFSGGDGTVIFNRANSFVGSVNVSQGVLGVAVDNALGGPGNQINMSGPSGITAFGNVLVIANELRAASVVTFDTNGNDLTYSGVIRNLNAGAGSVVKAGAGTLILEGAKTYIGTTTVNSGTLQLDGSLTSDVTVNAGATLSGNGSVAAARTVTIADGGIIAPGTSPGTLTVGNLVLNAGSVLNFELAAPNAPLGGAGSDLIVVTNNLTLDGTINTTALLGFDAGTYRVINYGNLLANNVLLAGSGPAGFTYSIVTTTGIGGGAGGVNLLVAFDGPRYWDGTGPFGNNVVNGGDGIWTAGATNWTDATGAGALSWANTEGVFAGSAGTVSVVGPQTFTSLTFTTGGYVLTDGGSGSLVTNGASVVDTATAAADVTVFDLVVSGAGSIVKQGVGYLDLTRANSYAGGTDIQGGTVRAYVSGAVGGGDVTMAGGTAFDLVTGGITLANNFVLNGVDTFRVYNGLSAIDGVISGSGSLFYDEAGTLALNAANTYSGGTTINFGAVQVGNDAALGAGGVTIADNTTLIAGVSGLALANAVATLGSGKVDSGPGVFTLNGAISGAGSISQVGTGNLVLNGNNSFTDLGINQGTVTVGTNTAAGIGSININDNATLAAGADGLALANAITTTANGIVNAGPGVFTLNGNIGGAGSISQVGTGTLVLNGDNSFTDLGINQGTVVVGTNTAAGIGSININDNATLAAGADGLALVNGVTTTGNGIVNAGPGVFTLNGNIGGAGSISQVGTGTLVLNGDNSFADLGINQGTVVVGSNTAAGIGSININNNATLAAGMSGLVLANAVTTTGAGTIDTGPGVLTMTGAIGGDGGIAKTGSGTLTLTGTSTYTGATSVDAGNLNVNGALGNTAVTVLSGATLSGTGTIAGDVTIEDGGTLSPGNSPGTLTVGALNLNGGSILNWELGAANTIGGPLNDLVIVNGDLVLDGQLNVVQSAGGLFTPGIYNLITYTGALTDNILSINSLDNGASGVVQTLVNGQVNLVVLSSPTVVLYWDGADGVGNGVISGGSGTWNLSNTNWTGGPPSALNSSWQQDALGVFTAPGGTVDITDSIQFQGLQFTGDGYVLTASGAGELTTATSSFVFTDAGVTTTITAPITGVGEIVKQGAGTLALGGNSSYAGGTQLTNGQITVLTNGALGTGTLTMASDTTLAAGVSGLVLANAVTTTGNGLVDSGAGVFTLNGDIGGAGSISQVGTGNLVLNGNNSFTDLGINQGTVTVGTNTAAGIGSININDNATLAAGVSGLVLANAITTTANGIVDSGAGVFTLNGNIGGAGSISQIGTGNLVLNGNNSFTDLGINQGTVTLGTSTAAGAGSININDNATLAAGVSGLVLANAITTTANGIVDSGAGVFTLNGNIGGAGSISQVGTGNLVLNGNNSFTDLGINQGTVTVGSDTAAGVGSINLNNNATLANNKDVTLANAMTTTGNGLVDVQAGTTLTLNGNIGGGTGAGLGGNLLTNGSFEAGNISGWTTTGQSFAWSATTGGLNAVDGSFYAGTGCVSTACPLSQTVATTAGQSYVLSYAFNPGQGGPSIASAAWNGTDVLQMPQGPAVWTNYSTTVVATGASSLLQFFGRQDPAFNGLDAVLLQQAGGAFGSLSQIGLGTLVLNGDNSFVNLGINQGTVQVGSNTAAGIGGISINDNATLQSGGAAITLANGVATTANGLINVRAGEVLTLNGNVVGAGSISQIGSGTLVLNGDNSFTDLGINQGTVTVGTNTAAGIGSININNDATLKAGADGLVLANAITTTANGLVDNSGFTFTLDGTIGGAGSISSIGLGNLVLNGANSFTDLGINQGTVTIGTNTAAGIGSININDNATLAAGVSGLVLVNAITTTANGLVDSGGGVFTLNGNIGGAGSISQIGTGNLVLNGDNSFVNLGINQGTVTVGTNTAAGSGSINVNDNATLAAGVSGLVLANAITTTANGIVDSGAGVFTLNGNIGGAGSISQVGTGNLVLNGNNSFTDLGINQGTVTVGTSTAAGAGSININDNATLAAGADGLVLANDVTTTANGIVDNNGFVFTLNGNIGGAGSISSIDTGTLVLNGANSFTNLGINQGTVQVGSNTAAGIGAIAINDNTTLQSGGAAITLANAVETTANGLVNARAGEVLTLNGNVIGAGSISQIGTGTLVLNGDNSFTNLGINQGTVQVGSNTAAGIGSIAINNNATLQSGGAAVTLANAVETTANGLVNVRAGEVLTLSGNVIGAGSISQIGSGNLVLNGNNSFTNLGINQGTVTVGTNTAAGIGAIAINNNATLAAGVSGLVLANAITTTANGIVNSGPGVFTLNGNIDGAGSISQVGIGNLVLNGNNSFTNLGINQGTVTVGTNTAAGIGGIAINNNATLAAGVSGLVLANAITTTANGIVNSGPGVFTLNGNINGAGSISQVSTGNLVLNGANSFRNLGINQGTVTVGTSTAAGIGGIAINNNATLAAGVSGLVLANAITTTANGIVNSGPGVFTLNGNINGAGSISQVGTGNLVLNGANSFTNLGINQGKVTLGTNTAGGIGAIAINNNATLVAGANITLANQIVSTANGFIDTGANTATLNGVISGVGSLTKQGSGGLIINAINTITGPTTVAAGRLSVNGSLASSATTVQSGATLAGTGTVGALTVQSGGTVAPGNSGAGTLSVNGSVTLAAGSTYQAELNGLVADRITASGAASIAGGIVVTNISAPGAAFNTSYTLLSSSARTGNFATTSFANFGVAFLPTLEYTATSVILRLTPNSLVNIGGGTLTGNPLAVATAFDAAVKAGYNPQPFFPLFTQGANFSNALSQLSGELHSAERRVLLEDTRVVREAAFDRLNAGLSAISGASSVTTTDGDKATTFWLRAAGSWGKASADGIGSRFETEQRGVLTGIDFANDGFKAGAMFHYTSTDLTFDVLGKSKLESTGGAIYAGYRQPGEGFAVGLGGSIAGNKAKGARAITAPGLQQSLTSSISGTTYQIFGEVAYDLVGGDIRFEPFGRVAHAQVRSDAFAEAGGIAALVGKGQRNNLTVVDAGLRGGIQNGIVELSGSAAWHRTSGDLNGLTYSSITGLNSDAGIRAVALDRDAVALEAKADFSITPTIKLGAGYSGIIGSKNKDHGARATLTIGF